jgi:hypothetical protein
VGAVTLLLSVVGASSAQAAPTFHCEASALRATIASTQTVEPVTQGRSGDCANGQATPAAALPGLLNAQALFADTSYDAATPSGSANGGVAHLNVLPSPELLAQGRQQVIDAINALPLTQITIPNPIPLPPPLPSLPTTFTLDLHAALISLIPPPAASLLSADLLNAQANVACQAGGVVYSGNSQVAGLKVLGQDVGGPLEQELPLFDSRNVSLSQLLDTGEVTIFDGNGLPIVDPLVVRALRGAVAQLPQIPASLLAVRITPNEQLRGDDYLIQRALHASISLAGQPVLDAVLGEAKTSAAPDTCAPPAPAPPAPAPAAAAAKAPAAGSLDARGGVAEQLLACSDRKLVLVDVLKQGSRVRLLGAANRQYVGKKVAIRLRATGKVVAHATVRKDGSFQTSAAMPPRAYLATNKRANSVRYRAEIGKELSLPLKLQRRLLVNSLTSKGGNVTISGRVVRPLTTPVSTIRLVRRVSCHKVVLVKRFKPNADGTFRVTVKAPRGQAAAVYRMVTSVREKASNPRSYPTYTLPRGVALNKR